MTRVIVLLGLCEEEFLSQRAHEFGWRAECVHDLNELKQTCANFHVAAVYFDPRAMRMSWRQTLGHVLRAAPAAYPIACLRFADLIPVEEFTDQGGFYVLRLPFASHEVQQSLGFVRAALDRKSAATAELKNAAAKAS